MNKAPLFPRDFKNIALYSVITILITFYAVLGATQASAPSEYWYIGRYSNLAVAFYIGLTMIRSKAIISITNKRFLLSIFAGHFLAYLMLRIISVTDTSLVSNRSYGHIIGTSIGFFFIICALFTAKYFVLFIYSFLKNSPTKQDELKKFILAFLTLFCGYIFYTYILLYLIFSIIDFLSSLGLLRLII